MKDTTNLRARFIDRARESKYMYWGSLLTINGILLSVFSAVSLFPNTHNHLLISLLVVSSIVSCWILIWNFFSTKRLYESITVDYETYDQATEEEKDVTLQKRVSQGESIKRNEGIVQSLLFIETFILLLILFW